MFRLLSFVFFIVASVDIINCYWIVQEPEPHLQLLYAVLGPHSGTGPSTCTMTLLYRISDLHAYGCEITGGPNDPHECVPDLSRRYRHDVEGDWIMGIVQKEGCSDGFQFQQLGWKWFNGMNSCVMASMDQTYVNCNNNKGGYFAGADGGYPKDVCVSEWLFEYDDICCDDRPC